MRTPMAVFLIASLLPLRATAYADSPTAHDDLQAAIRLVIDGMPDKAAIALDAAIRELAASQGHDAELAQAHLYLALAYLGLEQADKARDQVRVASTLDAALDPDPTVFPPIIFTFLAGARPATGTTVAPPGHLHPPAPRGNRTLLLGLGGVAALGAGVALASGSNASAAPSGTLVPTPTPNPNPTPTPAPIPTPAPTPTPVGSRTLNFRLTPDAASARVSLEAGSGTLTATATSHPRAGVPVTILYIQDRGGRTLAEASGRFHIDSSIEVGARAQAGTYVVGIRVDSWDVASATEIQGRIDITYPSP